MTRAEIEAEIDRLREEAARLAQYDLTIEGGRARTKFEAVVARDRVLREMLAKAAP